MAQGSDEDAALAKHSRPGRRIGPASIEIPFHALRLLNQNDVNVFRKVLDGIPFLKEFDAVLQTFKAGEFRVHAKVPGLLLCIVADSLAAEHFEVRINLS